VKRKRVKSAQRPAKSRAVQTADSATAPMLPMEIKIGDRFTDHDDFEWEVLTHPVVLHGGKSLRARIGRPGFQRLNGSSLGVEIQALEAQSPDDLGRAFALMIRAEVGAIQIIGDAMFSVYGKQIADLVVQSRPRHGVPFARALAHSRL
jgi:hypothetical protein